MVRIEIMDCMDIPSLVIDRTGGGALYLQLTAALAEVISTGDLAAGARLPSERDLAVSLGVSRTTTVNAYRELEARGLVRGFVGRGTFVCAEPGPAGDVARGAPFAWRGKVALRSHGAGDVSLRGLIRAATDPGMISFAAGAAAFDCFPLDAFRAMTDRILEREAKTGLGLGPVEGQPRLRRAIATRTGIDPERVLVLSGAQQGIDLVARCLIDPGDVVILDRPGYLGAIQSFRAAGARLVGWDVRRGDLSELDDLLLRYRPKLLYTCPTYQNPTGITLDERTRRGLLELASRHRIPVIEDDPYRELGFAGPPPPTLAALDRGDLVIHIGTFAKTLAGGLRLGWLAAAPAIIDHLAQIKGVTDVSTNGVTQLTIAELLRSGVYDEHLAGLRAEHALRHEAMLQALTREMPPGAISTRRVAGGLYLWCRLGQGLAGRTVLRGAVAAGVTFAAGEHFYADAAGGDEIRLCFSTARPAQIADGIRRLGAVVRQTLATPGHATTVDPVPLP